MADPRAPSYEDLEPEGEAFDQWADPQGGHEYVDDEYDTHGMGPLGDYEFDEHADYGDRAPYNEPRGAEAPADDGLPYREAYARRGRRGAEGYFEDEGYVGDGYGDDRYAKNRYVKDRFPPPSRDAVATQAARTALVWGSRAKSGAHLNHGVPRPSSHEREEAPLEACSASVREAHELMNALASAAAATDNKIEAMGLAAAMVPIAVGLAPHEYRALWPSVPALVQGVMGVSRMLHQRPATRASIKMLPMILQNTIAQLAGRVARGYPVSQSAAAKALASETRAALSQPQRRPRTRRRQSRSTRTRGNDFN